MKKLTFLFSLILVSAMLLAACSDGGQGGAQGTVFPTGQAGGTPGGEQGTPGAGGELTAEPTTTRDPITGSGGGSGDTGAGTATAPADGGGGGGAGGGGAGGAGATTPTTDAGAGGTAGTPTVEGTDAAQTPTVEAGTGGTGGTGGNITPTVTLATGGSGGTGNAAQTPTASTGSGAIPQTGQEDQYVLLSNILKMQVQGQDGNQVGSVGGVLIARAGGAAGTSPDTGTNPLQTTPNSSGAQNTPTVGAGAGNSGGAGSSGGSGGMSASGERPRVSYVLVTVTGGTTASTTGTTASTSAQDDGDQVLIPWQAFDVSGLGLGASSGPVAANQAETPTPSSGGGQTGSDDLALVLTVESTDLAGAPRFEAGAFNGQVGSDVAQFWSGQIAGIPATGAAGADDSDQVLIRGQIGSIRITGSGGENMGQVRDFVVDSETGELAYAVLSGGSTFQGDVYVVPTRMLIWQAGQGQGNNPGSFQMNVPSSVFSGAPSVGSVDEIETNAEWFSEVDAYWGGNNK